MIIGVISFFGYVYSEEVKSFLSHLTSVQFPAFDWVTAIFAAGMIVGSIAFAWTAISNIRQREQEKKHEEPTEILGIEFFNSRVELRKKYPLGDFLSQARNKIVILGGSFEYVAIQNRVTIRNILEQDKSIEFLFQNPDWISSAKPSEVIAFTPPKEGIIRSLETLCKIKNELGTPKKSRCIIKTYEVHATYSCIIIDPDSPESQVLVELIPYDTQAESRPVIVFNRKGNEALYETWLHSYKSVSDSAKEYMCPKEAEKLKEIDSKSRRQRKEG